MWVKCKLWWGCSVDSEASRVEVNTTDELETAIDAIEASAIKSSKCYEVDMRRERISNSDPILVQFIVGDPLRGSLLWHFDGETQLAIDPTIPELFYNLQFERVDGQYFAEPPYTRITPHVVRQALVIYLLTNQQPDGLEWYEAPTD